MNAAPWTATEKKGSFLMMTRRRLGTLLAGATLAVLGASAFQAMAASSDAVCRPDARCTPAAAAACDPADCAPTAACDPRACDPKSCPPAACDAATSAAACQLAVDLTAADCDPADCRLVCVPAAPESSSKPESAR